MKAKEQILQEKLVIIARNIPMIKLLNCCEALLAAGICCLETTFDHSLSDPIEDNCEKIKAIRSAFGSKICLGAGTTLSVDEVRAAYEAGAEYIISPNTNTAVIHETKRCGLLSISGAMTPTEICRAWEEGADMVKIFPADNLGIHYLQNIKGPLPHIPLMATGGVNPDNIPQLLSAGINVVGTGVTVLKKDCIDQDNYETVQYLAKMHREVIVRWQKENEK